MYNFENKLFGWCSDIFVRAGLWTVGLGNSVIERCFFTCTINGRSSFIHCLMNFQTKILNFNTLKQIHVLTAHDWKQEWLGCR